ncbi:hypothetical protein CALVIDRAFT_485062, partial [Calocera viscosa TUFC12733]
SHSAQVVRYSALLGGIFYGIVHRRTLQSQEDVKKEAHEYERKEKLIKEAREAWQRKQAGPSSGVITDPEDPKFDLEKALAQWEKDA